MNSINFSSLERQYEIKKLIESKDRITVPQICEYFGISQATARRDLGSLSNKGLIKRVHGGAIKIQYAPPEKPFLERSNVQTEEKKRIGITAADLVEDGDTIFLGSGTTVYEVAKNLHKKKNLTVITNSLLVIDELNNDEDITIISIGGILRKSEQSFIGHITEQTLQELRADKVIMGIRAISLDQGLTNEYLPETLTDRAIMKMGKELIIVADHTKCNRVSTIFVAPLKSIQIFIVSKNISEEFCEALRDTGIKVLLA